MGDGARTCSIWSAMPWSGFGRLLEMINGFSRQVPSLSQNNDGSYAIRGETVLSLSICGRAL